MGRRPRLRGTYIPKSVDMVGSSTASLEARRFGKQHQLHSRPSPTSASVIRRAHHLRTIPHIAGGISKLYVLHRERHRSSAPFGHTTIRKARRNRAARSTPDRTGPISDGFASELSNQGADVKAANEPGCQTKPGQRTNVGTSLLPLQGGFAQAQAFPAGRRVSQ